MTLAGVLLLIPAAATAYMVAVFATSSDLQREFAGALGPRVAPYGFLLPVGVGVVMALVFGWAGLATMRRWRGWRIWAGVIAWGTIASFVLSLFAPPAGNDAAADLKSGLIFVAIAVFVLVAKRREWRPDIPAVFR